MRAILALARAHGVAVGAHPGLPDLVGFGRREMHVTPQEVEDLVLYQIGALAGMAAAQGLRLQHVKPHGALYTMAARDSILADAIARAVASIDSGLFLVGLPGSELLASGRRAGLRTAREGFADRAYAPNGRLVPRGDPGALIEDEEVVVRRALSMVRERQVAAVDGSLVSIEIDTLCVHGDTPGAGDLTARIRQTFREAGLVVGRIGTVD
jgi:UPF0271 protein